MILQFTNRCIVVPYLDDEETSNSSMQKVQMAKDLLADENPLIRLHDFTIEELRRFLAEASEDRFALHQEFSNDELLDRISRYEKSVWDLCGVLASISYWARPEHNQIIQKVLSRSTARLETESGVRIWLALR